MQLITSLIEFLGSVGLPVIPYKISLNLLAIVALVAAISIPAKRGSMFANVTTLRWAHKMLTCKVQVVAGPLLHEDQTKTLQAFYMVNRALRSAMRSIFAVTIIVTMISYTVVLAIVARKGAVMPVSGNDINSFAVIFGGGFICIMATLWVLYSMSTMSSLKSGLEDGYKPRKHAFFSAVLSMLALLMSLDMPLIYVHARLLVFVLVVLIVYGLIHRTAFGAAKWLARTAKNAVIDIQNRVLSSP